MNTTTTTALQPLQANSGERLSGVRIAEMVRERFAELFVAVYEHRGQTLIEVRREGLLEVARYLHDEPALCFNYLADVTGIDNLKREVEPRFESIITVRSIPHGHRVSIKVRMPEDDPSCPSISSVWRGANWHERESYDLMGIIYTDHPNLKRIMMPEGWIGHPLRKDFPLGGVKSFFYKRDSNPHFGEPPGYIPRIRVQEGDI